MATRQSAAVWLEKYGRWQIKVTNDAGVRKTFTCPQAGRTGQRECNRRADEWLRESLVTPDIRVKDAYERYLATLPKEQTRIDGRAVLAEKYRKIETHFRIYILPAIGVMKLSAVKRYTLQQIIDDAAKTGLTKKTLQNIRGSISVWLTWCRKNDLTTLSTELLDIPEAPSKEHHILQPDDLQKLFAEDVEDWYLNFYRLAVVTGYRFGELIALQRRHYTDGVLIIRGAVNQKGVLTKGKNANAVRDTVLSDIGKKIVDDQLKALDAAGIVSPYIFPSATGSVSSQNTIRHHWERFCERYGLTKTTVYELRHTYVSVCSARADLTLAELKATVGHSQNMDTLGVYGHAVTGTDVRAAAKINSAFESVIFPSPKTQN